MVLRSSSYYLTALLKLIFVISWITSGVNGGRFPSPIYADVAGEIVTSTFDSEGKSILGNGSLTFTTIPLGQHEAVKSPRILQNLTLANLKIDVADRNQGNGVGPTTAKHIELEKAGLGAVSGWVYVLSGLIGLLLVASTVYCFAPFLCADRHSSLKGQPSNNLLYQSSEEKVEPLSGTRNFLPVIIEDDDRGNEE